MQKVVLQFYLRLQTDFTGIIMTYVGKIFLYFFQTNRHRLFENSKF